MQDIPFNKDLDLVLDQIKRGAFLTVKSEDSANTMTIGWATIGIIWNKPIMMVMVRKSRHTYEIIEKGNSFTVSVPVNQNLKKALSYCGTYSGRDVDKFKEMNLTLKKAKSVESPIIKECSYQYECRILFSQGMDGSKLDIDVKNRNYPIDDYHTLYFGEIIESYILD